MLEGKELLLSTTARGEENQVPSYINFINAIKSPATKEKYSYLLSEYLKYLKLHAAINTNDNLESLLSKSVRTIENEIIKYIIDLKENKGLSYSSLNNKLAAIYLFYTMNDIVINRKKLGKYLGEHVKTVKDRGYTIEEIRKIVDACSLKYKIVVTMMASSGCRIGAVPSLMIKNLKYHDQYQLYQITFYENTKEEYYSFVSFECSNYIREYLQFRERCGEKLKPNSPLIRDDFIIDDLLPRIENPKFLSLNTYHKYLKYVLVRVGIRTITSSNKRKEISQNHGFRKFCLTTMANARINPEIREMLLSHSIGLSDSYYRPTVNEMLNEYLKVVNDLTIDPSNRLQKQLEIIGEKNDYQQFVIDKKFKEKDEQIAILSTQLNDIAKQFQEINQRTKVDRNVIKKLSSEERLELFVKDMDQKHKKKLELEQQLLKYTRQQQNK